MEKLPAVYILTNKPWGTLYTGVTSDLPARIYEHKKKFVDGFTAKYRLDKLVYYECSGDMYAAITREKQIKAGSRKKKLKLIVGMNPEWRDLYEDILG
jgi:putative endonuclease